MPRFSDASKANLLTCHCGLQHLFNEVIKHYDCSVIDGHRGEADQNSYYLQKKSQLQYPESKHNKTPSRAVDVAPYPIEWHKTDGVYTKEMIFFGGYVMGTAERMGINVRWGGDWNVNMQVGDNKFDDLAHFELRS